MYKDPEECAIKITDAIAKESFRIYKEKRFRSLINFGKIDQTEQDRIFNELVISGICYTILLFGSLRESQPRKRAFFNEMAMWMKSRYSTQLSELGVEKEFSKLWRQVIDMRLDEYQKEYKKYKQEIGNVTQEEAWFSVVSIGGCHHIRRGKSKPDDPLFKIVMDYIKTVLKQTVIIIK